MRYLLPMLMMAAACGAKTDEIDDPAMTSTGEEIGEESAKLASLDAAADDSEVQGQINTVGGGLQSMVGHHQSYSNANSALKALPAGMLPPPSPDIASGTSWDGNRLQANWSTDFGGVSLTYLIDLDMSNGIDGEYYLEYVAGVLGTGAVYEVSAVYDAVTTDGASCVTGGTVTITYDISVEAGGFGVPGVDQGGTVVVEYSGCNEVTVSGT